jgi:hypothetical protein
MLCAARAEDEAFREVRFIVGCKVNSVNDLVLEVLDRGRAREADWGSGGGSKLADGDDGGMEERSGSYERWGNELVKREEASRFKMGRGERGVGDEDEEENRP